TIDESDISSFMIAFEEAYDNLYGKGTGWKEAGVEVINFRIDAIGLMPKPTLRKFPLVGGDPREAQKGMRSCYFSKAEGFVPTPIYDGQVLSPGMSIKGPAAIEMNSTSAIVNHKQEVYVDEYCNIIIHQL
ncbi:MAG TPA: hypothetical protein VMW90_09530, partial [Acidobacteriota bacterium]|nr:hypothetical protein [Acidobacteriota bacterium]